MFKLSGDGPLLSSAKRQLRIVAGTVLIVNILLYAGLSAAHDTEIYFAAPLSDDQTVANVLFMFDTSGSMDRFDGTQDSRISRLKQAMIDVVTTSSNVRIGLGAFNGTRSGGAILSPTINVDEDLCPGAACSELELRSTVQHFTDDAQENVDGIVDLGSSNLNFNNTVPAGSEVTVSYTIESGADDAMQSLNTDDISIDSDSLQVHYDPLSTASALGETVAGFRFTGVSIPAGATVTDARLKLRNIGDSNVGSDVDSRVWLENNLNAVEFADVDGQRIADRSKYSYNVTWRNLPESSDDTLIVETPNLAFLISEAVDDPSWSGVGDLMFMLARPGSGQANDANRRGYSSFEAGYATELEVTYSTAAMTGNIVGLRFDDLNIPRGATINHAALEFTSEAYGNHPTLLTIVGQDTDDAAPFTATANDLSNRMASVAARTAASATWDVERWVNADLRMRSSDISSVVQEIVDRSGWCGGNAMALFVEGGGDRVARSREQGPWDAPTLRVNYSPASVDFNSTCVRQAVTAGIEAGTDDMMESVADGALDGTSDLLRTHVGSDVQLIGLRFAGLDVPQGASISDAYIMMNSGGYVAGGIDLQIDVEATEYANRFDSAVANTISGRSYSGSGVIWQDVPEVVAGNSMRTPSLKQLVESTVAQSGWVNNNAISFVMTVNGSSTGQRSFASVGAPASSGATLVVHYQMDSADLAGEPIVLHTGRDELIKTMMDLGAAGATPLVDSYYEAAQYMLGGAVDFGKKRGNQTYDDRFHRISHANSFSGGHIYRPPTCSRFDLNSRACVEERIDGDAFYVQPEFGECQANQIVLLSDGESTVNSSESRIQSVTSLSTCESRSNARENCGVELAGWLFDTDHDTLTEGKQSVVTHTIGFNFSTPFLTEVASAGGGNFYPAESASDLSQAFKNIIDNAISLDSSFVAPTTTVSQTNRLVNNNDVYYGMFKPDTDTMWDGNLKRYQLAKNTTTGIVEVFDALLSPATDSADGGISSSARSFWSSTVDGSDVGKGGAASKLTLTRNLYVSLEDTTDSSIVLSEFHEDTTAITDVLLGIEGTDASYRTELLQWARGVDIKDFDGDGDTAEVRTQIGDPLHSTQFLLNYKNDVGDETGVIFMGTNQGFLHAINTDDGTEEFAYIPQELLKNLEHFYKNNSVDHDKRPYGLDGAISGWHDDTNNNGFVDNNESAYVFTGMRRGGRNYYALDVSDLSSPEFKWVIEGGIGDFAELGQSWSRAVKTKVTYSGTDKDVLIFAGGYDPDKDTQTERADDDEGTAIFIVDARTGEHLTSRSALDLSDMRYSIPSDIRVIDVDSNGFADMMLVGDTGGQLWRFDIDNNASSDSAFMTGGVIADLGGSGTTWNRRFYYEPDVALIRNEAGQTFLNIGIGSGFRAHPDDNAVQDRFYAIRSSDIFGPPRDSNGDINYSAVKVSDSNLVDVTNVSGTLDTSGNINKGWYFTLSDSGEKVLSTALTIDNTLIFTTYAPSTSPTNVCSVSLGSGRVYSVSAEYGDPLEPPDTENPDDSPGNTLMNARYNTLQTPGIPPRVSGLIAEASPNMVTQLVGLESVGDNNANAPFERTFWAEQ